MINGVCRFDKVHYRAQGRLPTGCWGEGLMGHNVCAHGWAWRDGIFWSSRSGWNQPHIFVPQRLGCSGQQGIWKGECSVHVLGADHVHMTTTGHVLTVNRLVVYTVNLEFSCNKFCLCFNILCKSIFVVGATHENVFTVRQF